MALNAFNLDHESGSKARISLYGATVISWTVQGQEKLFLSEKAHLDGTKPIRGGIPPVFPVFGKVETGPCATLPQHGFARNRDWKIKSKSTNHVALSLSSEDASFNGLDKSQWPYKFELLYTITLAATTLESHLEILNKDTVRIEFQALLHTYLRVSDIHGVQVHGLQGIAYKDKTVGYAETMETSENVEIATETDRVYPNVNRTVTVSQKGKLSFTIDRKGFPDIVLWNPWIACKKMSDFGPDNGFENMICVEAGAVHRWFTLSPNETYVGSQIITAHL